MKKEPIPYYTVTTPYDLSYRKDSPAYPVGPHTHNAAEIYFTLTPLPDVLIDDTVLEVPAGSLIVIPPFCVHQLYHQSGIVYERYILSVHDAWLSQIFFGCSPPFPYLKAGEKAFVLPLSFSAVSDMTEAFRIALQTGCGTGIRSVTAFFSLLEQIHTLARQTLPEKTLLQKLQNLSPSQKLVNELISHINEHLGDNLGLTELAAHFYLNADYLSRLFKEHTHTSIGHYIAIQRITKAQMLLREHQSISQVQEALGYSSYAHFAKTFKKLTGMTPGQYKNSEAS